jgi:hypothetical protein
MLAFFAQHVDAHIGRSEKMNGMLESCSRLIVGGLVR